MLQLKNRLHQPLVLQCAGGKSIHLLSRGTATIQERDMSADIQRAIRKGLVSQKTLSGTVSRAIPKPAPQPRPEPVAVPDGELVPYEPPDDKPPTRRKGGRQ
jgi:hypothetical protein